MWQSGAFDPGTQREILCFSLLVRQVRTGGKQAGVGEVSLVEMLFSPLQTVR